MKERAEIGMSVIFTGKNKDIYTLYMRFDVYLREVIITKIEVNL